MSNEKVLVSKYGSPDRPLKIGDIAIPCYVLENEKRVIAHSGMLIALGMSPTSGSGGGARRLEQFALSNRINPFISSDLMSRINQPIKFRLGGIIASGYDATILVDICNAIMDARKAGVLTARQELTAERSEMLVRAFAKTGIIALVDEATGYQEVREKDALKQFLDKFLLAEEAKWVKTFPDDFFEMIFRMKGWTWHYASTKKPQVVGHYVNDLVYARIAPEVLKELRQKNPSIPGRGRKHKHTQFINVDFGHPKLREHLFSLVALGRASGFNWNNFNRMVQRAFPKFNKDGSQSPELPLDID